MATVYDIGKPKAPEDAMLDAVADELKREGRPHEDKSDTSKVRNLAEAFSLITNAAK